MTTPQNVLYELHYKLKHIIDILDPQHDDDDGIEFDNIYELVTAIRTHTKELYQKMELLEDKMNVIIKLLGKEV